MITKFSYYLAEELAEKAGRTDTDFIRYGIEITLVGLIKLGVILLTAFLFGVFIEVIILSLSFAVFRIVTGGVHMSTFLRCLISSLVLFITPAFFLQNIAQTAHPFYLLLMTFMIVSFVIFRYVPVPAANRPIPEQKRLFFKWTSFLFLIVWITLMINIIITFPAYSYLPFFSAIGLLLQSLTLVPFGYQTFVNIDLFLQKRKERRTEVELDEKAF